ncbi:MAG: helix-turn-helix domain-containing protein [Bacteroidales bacterium]|nr:helix-turn-helix domain-containing protein [Bacteroidales bacterium]
MSVKNLSQVIVSKENNPTHSSSRHPEEGVSWIFVNEVMARLRISRSTVSRWVKNGYLKAYRFQGSRIIYFSAQEVDNLISQNAILPSGRFDKVGMNFSGNE